MKIFSQISLSMVLILSGWQGAYASEDERLVEEVVVTGSYLKRSAEDSPSPLSVYTSADIQDLGASDVAEIVQAMPWSSGSQTRASTFQGEGADGRNSINLRNLGNAATLPLINGKRQVASWYNGRGNASVNINGLLPNIAIERIEIIKDGASALYGSDAVAGVVNFITKDDFEGAEFMYQYTTDDETKNGDTTNIEMMFGVQGDRGGIVASASYLNRDEINVDNRYDRFGGTTISATGQPGRLAPISGQTPTWAANGLNPGQPVDDGALPRNPQGTSFGQADVDCETSAALERGGALGPLFGNLFCIYDYGSFFSLQAQEKLKKMLVDGHYDFTEDFEVYFEFAANSSEFDRLNSLNPNAPALTIPVSSQGQPNPGSVEDAFRRGIEPLEYANITRLIGGTSRTPEAQRPLQTFTNANRNDNRWVIGGVFDFDIGERSWTINASYTDSEHNTGQTEVQDTLSSHMELAIIGLGGPECDVASGTPGSGNAAYASSGGEFDAGDCYFFNPFGNSQFARDGSTQTDLNLVNPAELYAWLQGRFTYDLDYSQEVIDIVASGDLFTDGWGPIGPIGLAVGFQRRHDHGKANFDGAVNANNLDFAYGAQDWRGTMTALAGFGEIGIPIGENIDVNFALRYEDFDEINEDTFDPKVTVLVRPTDWLSLRGSGGSSYRVPSLQQLFGSITTVANQADIVGGTAFKPSLSVGNNFLKPESADTWNLGFSLIPGGFLEGLQFDFDYYSYDYKDIITRQASATILSEDNDALAAYRDANLGGSCATVNDCYIDAVNAGVGNREQVVRNTQAILLRILPRFENANSADITGADMNLVYAFDTDFGNWRIGAQAAWVDEYKVKVPNTAGGVTEFDGVGNYNSQNPVARPLPEWKVNGTLNWSWNSHRAFLIVKYVDGVESDVPASTAGFFAATATLAGNGDLADDILSSSIPSFTTADIQYSYDFGETGFFADTMVTLGVQNFTNEDPPVMANVTAYDGTLHDPRGRIWFLRMSASL